MKIEDRITCHLENGEPALRVGIDVYTESSVIDRLCEYEDVELNPDEIKALKEKQIAKAPNTDFESYCPNCGCMVSESEFDRFNYCVECGQKLLWR